jgi:hypothetical protein
LRKAINENPIVQIALLGGMAPVVAFLLFTRVLGGSSEEAAPATESTAAPATGAATEAGAAVPGAAPSEGSATESAPTAPAPTTTPHATGVAPPTTEAIPGVPAPSAGVESEFVAGPGLPKPVVSAYDDGKAIVLLIEKRKGIDDQALLGSVERLRGRSDLAVFLVPAKDVSRYARITQGVQLDRVPAIVVVRPRRLSDGVPEATVSYGFRGPESAQQAVEDALFDGKAVTYDP